MQAIMSLPPKTIKYLEILCSEVNKTTALTQQKDFEYFAQFVIVAHDEKVELSEQNLLSYLKERNWPAEQASAIAKRYTAAQRLLILYDQYRSGVLKL